MAEFITLKRNENDDNYYNYYNNSLRFSRIPLSGSGISLSSLCLVSMSTSTSMSIYRVYN